ncbi:hypothetical protein UFOVP1370_10 [uncultured Caudovirales phage]|uniref:Uncharacterized protein n=1 Tax=uncultured Caudovirales phage TaxID=2100421 RepID=A0A6J5S293_9CAUD|nr:hypothetical protein UFOVP1370_10 [uncultured Caudovirales phage]
MERKLILDLLTGAMAIMVFAFLWVGILIGRKSVNWENNHEGVAYIFMCLLLAVATTACVLNAYFWFTEHIIYIP